jgi:alpha-N-arabinofuranosidase
MRIHLALLTLLFTSAYAQNLLYKETFENPLRVGTLWQGSPAFEGVPGGKYLSLASADASKSVSISKAFDAALLSCKKVRLTVRVKADAISAKAKDYNGVKIMLPWSTKDGKKDWPQAIQPAGTWDWKTVTLETSFPENLASVAIHLGLEGVTGKAWFDEVKLEIWADLTPADLAAAGNEPPKGPELAATVTVDFTKAYGKVNRRLFGHNIEAASGKDIFGASDHPNYKIADGWWDPVRLAPRAEVLAAAKEIGMSMLRWPGGCLTHNFDWKKTIGPRDARPASPYGLDEYLASCEAAGVEPLITVSEYIGGPQDSADLVEYLNAKADSAHPWAQKRAAQGRVKPWAVKWFEMANEADHGNHDVKPFRKFTPAEYVTWYNESVKRMKAVDPTIQCGPHMGTGTPPTDPWNAIVLRGTKELCDYVVIHTYLPAAAPGDWTGSSAIAQRLINAYQSNILANTGRRIPIAITEFNNGGHPYRFSWNVALFCADYLRVMMQPSNNILMAQYWQLVNGYFGFLRTTTPFEGLFKGEAATWIKLPTFHTFRMVAAHAGEELVATRVDATRRDPTPQRAGAIEKPAIALKAFTAGGASARIEGPDAFTLILADQKGEQYPEGGRADVTGGARYRLAFEARISKPLEGARLGLGLMDQRGWTATGNANAIEGMESATTWTSFEGELQTLPDAKGLVIVVRIINKDGAAASARVDIRKIRMEFAGFPEPFDTFSAQAMRSEGGKRGQVLLFNLHGDSDQRVALKVGKTPRAAKAWGIVGPRAEKAMANKGVPPRLESVETFADGISLTGKGGEFSVLMPPLSMMAVELEY